MGVRSGWHSCQWMVGPRRVLRLYLCAMSRRSIIIIIIIGCAMEGGVRSQPCIPPLRRAGPVPCPS
eukprot:2388283-Rhodomonas_salina.4